jgi:hypothetical protein
VYQDNIDIDPAQELFQQDSLEPNSFESSSELPARQSRLISRVLSPAAQLWLRSQVDSVDELRVQIEGGDRQILRGCVPRVSIAARRAVYQGLCLSQIDITGTGIQINLGQVLKGKPLRLLAVVPIRGEAMLHQLDLSQSLQSPTLAEGLVDLLISMLKSEANESLPAALSNILDHHPIQLQMAHVLIEPGRLRLSANLVSPSGHIAPLVFCTGLSLTDGSRLQLIDPTLLSQADAPETIPLSYLHGFEVDLGPDTIIEELRLEQGYMRCKGQINVIPAEE